MNIGTKTGNINGEKCRMNYINVNHLVRLYDVQNYYWAAKLELFLNLDPRMTVGELKDLLREYHVYYPPEHDVGDSLRRCIQSGF